MRQTLRTILKTLDGQPTGRSRYHRGQSLVEMALTTPLLILMVLGLTEIGFLANNYLILMDAVRAGGRAAVNLDPTSWPYGQARHQERLDCDTDPGWYTMMIGTVNTAEYGARKIASGALPRANGLPNYTVDTTNDPPFGFFDEVACQTIYAMSPLRLNDTEDAAVNKDDVVVSAVSFSLMEYGAPGNTLGKLETNSIAPKAVAKGNTWVTVTGRWPLENRFCGETDALGAWTKGDSRDPFDYLTGDAKNGNFGFTTGAVDGAPPDYYNPMSTFSPKKKLYEGIEIDKSGFFAAGSHNVLNPKTDNQNVRGFVFTGKNKNVFPINTPEADNCYGSRFRVQDIEERLNLDATFNKDVPNGGLVIVEIFWQHHPLFFGPLFQGFSNDRTKDPVLHIWGFFPVPSVESTATPS